MFVQSVSSAALEKSLSATWKRVETISNNIANQDTPGFKAKHVSFESALRQKLDRIENTKNVSRREAVAGIRDIEPAVYEDGTQEVRADGNNVNIHNEQIELARALLQYQALQQKISGHYSMLKYAVTGGR